MRPIDEGFDLDAALSPLRSEFTRRVLEEANENKSKTARLLGFRSRQPLKTICDRLRESGLVGDEFL